jgi:hypothetical protein
MARTYIAAEGNVEVPAYWALVARGFDIHSDERGKWTASKGDVIFSADSPLALLGIAAMFDARGPRWQASDVEIDAFLAKFQDEI